MTATRKARKYWTCPACSTRNERIKRKCANEDCRRSRPKARVPAHAETLRDDSYETYNAANAAIHGVTDESCGVCGKPRSQERRHDRDHGHRKGDLAYGKPRGLACVHCNKHMPVGLTLELAEAVTAYLRRVENYYRERDAA